MTTESELQTGLILSDYLGALDEFQRKFRNYDQLFTSNGFEHEFFLLKKADLKPASFETVLALNACITEALRDAEPVLYGKDSELFKIDIHALQKLSYGGVNALRPEKRQLHQQLDKIARIHACATTEPSGANEIVSHPSGNFHTLYELARMMNTVVGKFCAENDLIASCVPLHTHLDFDDFPWQQSEGGRSRYVNDYFDRTWGDLGKKLGSTTGIHVTSGGRIPDMLKRAKLVMRTLPFFGILFANNPFSPDNAAQKTQSSRMYAGIIEASNNVTPGIKPDQTVIDAVGRYGLNKSMLDDTAAEQFFHHAMQFEMIYFRVQNRDKSYEYFPGDGRSMVEILDAGRFEANGVEYPIFWGNVTDHYKTVWNTLRLKEGGLMEVRPFDNGSHLKPVMIAALMSVFDDEKSTSELYTYLKSIGSNDKEDLSNPDTWTEIFTNSLHYGLDTTVQTRTFDSEGRITNLTKDRTSRQIIGRILEIAEKQMQRRGLGEDWMLRYAHDLIAPPVTDKEYKNLSNMERNKVGEFERSALTDSEAQEEFVRRFGIELDPEKDFNGLKAFLQFTAYDAPWTLGTRLRVIDKHIKETMGYSPNPEQVKNILVSYIGSPEEIAANERLRDLSIKKWADAQKQPEAITNLASGELVNLMAAVNAQHMARG